MICLKIGISKSGKWLEYTGYKKLLEVVKGKIELINESIELLNRENNILQQGESYITDFINRCEKVRNKIARYILNLPKSIDKDTYIKDYLISIKVQDNSLTYKDLSIKYANEVKALYKEIHNNEL